MSQSSQITHADVDKNMRPNAIIDGSYAWYSPKDAPFQVNGLAWFAQEQLYRRFPRVPLYPLSESVGFLADNPSGGQIRFQTDSAHLSVRVKLTAVSDFSHMPATGQCGVDCYVGQYFVNVTKYPITDTEYECELFSLPTTALRTITLNLPLYQGVEEISIGLDPEAQILPPPPYVDDRPVIAYGTSITQGGCASRPGMSYTNILSRRLNREFYNMGFSGSGLGEPDIARHLACIANPACYIIDYEANVTPERMQETLPTFLRIVRDAHPAVPLLVVSKVRYAPEMVNEEEARPRRRNREFMQQTVAALRAHGDAQVFFADGEQFLGDDFDNCSVDGCHQTDLGFLRMADALEPILREIIV